MVSSYDLFLTEEQRGAGSSNIDTYNAFVRQSAADGHPPIRSHSEHFRVVGSTGHHRDRWRLTEQLPVARLAAEGLQEQSNSPSQIRQGNFHRIY